MIPVLGRLHRYRPLRLFLLIVAAFYAYGAAVHVMNMAGFSGFDWSQAPALWQVLDLAYLILDIVVVVGLVTATGAGVAAFLLGASSQIVLYTVFREAVLQAPGAPPVTSEQAGYLDTLVVFHVSCLAIFGALAVLAARRRVVES